MKPQRILTASAMVVLGFVSTPPAGAAQDYLGAPAGPPGEEVGLTDPADPEVPGDYVGLPVLGPPGDYLGLPVLGPPGDYLGLPVGPGPEALRDPGVVVPELRGRDPGRSPLVLAREEEPVSGPPVSGGDVVALGGLTAAGAGIAIARRRSALR